MKDDLEKHNGNNSIRDARPRNRREKPKMEKVFCPKCGKEQLGRANRCWNCSTTLEQVWNVLSAELAEPEELSSDSRLTAKESNVADSREGNSVLPNAAFGSELDSDLNQSDLIQAQISNASSENSPLSQSLLDSNSDQGEVFDAEVVFLESTDRNDLRTKTGSFGSRSPSGKLGVEENQVEPTSVARIGSPFEQGTAVNLTRPDSNKRRSTVGQWQTEIENFSARGGAVASIGLGVYSVIGGYFTPLAMINSFLGLVLGLWGLSSKKRRWATIGMVICWLGIGVSITRFGWKSLYQPGGYFYSVPGGNETKEQEEEF